MSELFKALVALQADLPKVDKGETAHIPTKTGGNVTYSYADLADVAAAIHPKLAVHGLAFTAFPTIREDGKFVLHYSLVHVSGEERSGDYPLKPDGTPQNRGSEITYARRYCLCAVTGLTPDRDDDAAAAGQSPSAAARAGQRRGAGSRGGTAKRTPQAPPPVEDGEGERIRLLGRMFGLMGEIGIDTKDKDASLGYVNEILTEHGAPAIESRAQLTPAQIGWVIEKAGRAAEAEAGPPPEEEG